MTTEQRVRLVSLAEIIQFYVEHADFSTDPTIAKVLKHEHYVDTVKGAVIIVSDVETQIPNPYPFIKTAIEDIAVDQGVIQRGESMYLNDALKFMVRTHRDHALVAYEQELANFSRPNFELLTIGTKGDVKSVQHSTLLEHFIDSIYVHFTTQHRF